MVPSGGERKGADVPQRWFIQGATMNRNEFDASSFSVCWQIERGITDFAQGERVRRIGMLLNLRESNPRGKATVAAFVQRLKELGWTEGRNLQLDIRWGGDDTDRYRQYARELVALGRKRCGFTTEHSEHSRRRCFLSRSPGQELPLLPDSADLSRAPSHSDLVWN
jgi:hypothetical protein